MSATEAPQATRSAQETDPEPADVLVVFGITGDLAKVMTFRSLYRLEGRGLLDCPIVGVAVDDWTVDQLVKRARESIVGTGETIDEDVFDRFAARLSYVSGDFTDSSTYERVGVGDQRGADSGVLPRGPAVPLRHGREGACRGRPDRWSAGRRREAVRPRPGLGSGARRRAAPVHRRVAAPADRPLPREDGDRGDPLPPLRQHDARADLEPELRRIRPDHDGRGLRGRGSGALLRSRRSAPGRRRQPPHAGGGRDRDGAAGGRRHEDDPGCEGVAVSRDQRCRPRALRSWPVRRLSRHRRRRRGLDDRDVCGTAARDRQLALVGGAVLHPHRKAASDHADGGPPRLQEATAARLRRIRPRDPSPTSS